MAETGASIGGRALMSDSLATDGTDLLRTNESPDRYRRVYIIYFPKLTMVCKLMLISNKVENWYMAHGGELVHIISIFIFEMSASV